MASLGRGPSSATGQAEQVAAGDTKKEEEKGHADEEGSTEARQKAVDERPGPLQRAPLVRRD